MPPIQLMPCWSFEMPCSIRSTATVTRSISLPVSSQPLLEGVATIAGAAMSCSGWWTAHILTRPAHDCDLQALRFISASALGEKRRSVTARQLAKACLTIKAEQVRVGNAEAIIIELLHEQPQHPRSNPAALIIGLHAHAAQHRTIMLPCQPHNADHAPAVVRHDQPILRLNAAAVSPLAIDRLDGGQIARRAEPHDHPVSGSA